MPDEDIVFDDLVRGEITFTAGSVPDSVLVRANGAPLYTLTNPVDDALMGITHVLRGEDLLPSTPRQIALYQALQRIGVAEFTPRFGHLPLVMGEGNKKLSKRDPSRTSSSTASAASCPRACSTTWRCSAGRSPTTATCSPSRRWSRPSTSPGSAPTRRASTSRRPRRSTATHLRRWRPRTSLQRVLPYLSDAGVLPADADAPSSVELVRAVAPLVQERITGALRRGRRCCGSCSSDEDVRGRRGRRGEGARRGRATGAGGRDRRARGAVTEWAAAAIEQALKTALVDGLGLKPRKAFAPVRVAVSGRTVSPPLYESMELLGRERSMGRLRAALG